MVGTSKSKSLKKTNSECRISSEQNDKKSSLSTFRKMFTQKLFSKSVKQFFLDESPKCCGRHVVFLRQWTFNTHSFFIFVCNLIERQYFSVFSPKQTCFLNLCIDWTLKKIYQKNMSKLLTWFLDKEKTTLNYVFFLPPSSVLFSHYGFTLGIPKHRP